MKTRFLAAMVAWLMLLPCFGAQQAHEQKTRQVSQQVLWPAPVLQKYDANKDGCLDENERATMRADSLAGKFDLPGFRYAPGSPSRKLLDQRRKEILVKFDANKDGKLDDVELASLKAAILAGSIDEADQIGQQAGHRSSRDVNCAPNQKTMAPKKK